MDRYHTFIKLNDANNCPHLEIALHCLLLIHPRHQRSQPATHNNSRQRRFIALTRPLCLILCSPTLLAAITLSSLPLTSTGKLVGRKERTKPWYEEFVGGCQGNCPVSRDFTWTLSPGGVSATIHRLCSLRFLYLGALVTSPIRRVFVFVPLPFVSLSTFLVPFHRFILVSAFLCWRHPETQRGSAYPTAGWTGYRTGYGQARSVTVVTRYRN